MLAPKHSLKQHESPSHPLWSKRSLLSNRNYFLYVCIYTYIYTHNIHEYTQTEICRHRHTDIKQQIIQQFWFSFFYLQPTRALVENWRGCGRLGGFIRGFSVTSQVGHSCWLMCSCRGKKSVTSTTKQLRTAVCPSDAFFLC